MQKKTVGILVAVTVFSFLMISHAKQGVSAENKKAADFALTNLNGKTIKLSDFKDKVIILNFWATRCPPCVQEIPDFIKLYNKYKDKGLVIIGISLDRGAKGVKRFCQSKGVNYPIVMGNYEVTKNYGGIMGIPTTFIIDKNRNIVKKFIGYASIDVFESKIKRLLE
ncbi:TlpA family protein disulfide reductase [bacterium]|nr:TlpA family protein disulfide reductase [bacterium]